MVLSRRERLITIGTLVAVGLLALDRLALSPMFDAMDETDARRDALAAELGKSQAMISRWRQLAPKWREMVQSGMKSDPAEAESQVLHAIQNWAGETGVTLSLLKPNRQTEKTRLPVIAFQASGTGNLYSIARLVWRIQTSRIPIRVTFLQLAPRKEGADELSFQLRVSTVYAPSRPTAATGPATAADSGERS